MRNFRNREGFTLVELLVVILIGSIVTLAAVTVLLLGVRMQKQSVNTVQKQSDSRIILTVLDKMASENSIKKLITGPDSWYVCSTANKAEAGQTTTTDTVLFGFDSKSRSICTGGSVAVTLEKTGETLKSVEYNYTGGSPVIEGVHSSSAVMQKNNLLRFSIQTEEGTYTSSTYCRMAVTVERGDPVTDLLDSDNQDNQSDTIEQIVPNVGDTIDARKEFLKIVTSQRGSYGVIYKDGFSTGTYYSEWHIDGGWGSNGWNKDTPWCACFVTWALDVKPESEVNADTVYNRDLLRTPVLGRNINGLANVDKFIAYLDGPYTEAVAAKHGVDKETLQFWYPCESYPKPVGDGEYEIASRIEAVDSSVENPQVDGGVFTPYPGDLIFFDWIVDANDDSDHVGVVLTVANDYIYTVEGNSGDMVAVRRYRVDDPRIMGYGVLDWKLDIPKDAD